MHRILFRVARILMEWRLGVVCFPSRMCVEWLKVDGPSRFAVIFGTYHRHQVTGSPIGTCSSTPSLTSLSSPALTSSCQCRGTGIGVWYAVGPGLGAYSVAWPPSCFLLSLPGSSWLRGLHPLPSRRAYR